MKKLLSALVLVPVLAVASQVKGAQREPVPPGSMVVLRHHLGSGIPGLTGLEPASHVGDGVYHVPQLLPFYPTAGVLWPRVVVVECEKVTDRFVCDGYHWSPSIGRGEYLFIRPVLKERAPPTPPQVVREVVREVTREVPGPERIVLKEVPVKPKKE